MRRFITATVLALGTLVWGASQLSAQDWYVSHNRGWAPTTTYYWPQTYSTYSSPVYGTSYGWTGYSYSPIITANSYYTPTYTYANPYTYSTYYPSYSYYRSTPTYAYSYSPWSYGYSYPRLSYYYGY